MKLKTKLLHWKIAIIGDKDFKEKGYKIMPCAKCDKPFKSYPHYGETSDIIDIYCEKCEKNEETTTIHIS